MSIEGTNKDLPHSPYVGARADNPSTWDRIKRWSANNPRLSRVVWIALGLGLLALLIWAIYPRPQVNNRFNQTAQPVGVATAVICPIHANHRAQLTVTPRPTAAHG